MRREDTKVIQIGDRKIGGGNYNSENEFSLAIAYIGWFFSK